MSYILVFNKRFSVSSHLPFQVAPSPRRWQELSGGTPGTPLEPQPTMAEQAHPHCIYSSDPAVLRVKVNNVAFHVTPAWMMASKNIEANAWTAQLNAILALWHG